MTFNGVSWPTQTIKINGSFLQRISPPISSLNKRPWACYGFPLFSRHRFSGVVVRPVIRALHHSASFLPSGHVGLPESLVVYRGLLALCPLLDAASTSGLEQLWARRSRDHLFGPVAPAVTQQHLLRGVPLHLLSAASASSHGLLLRPHPDHHQTGEVRHAHSNVPGYCT